jgi:hypothetical protein
MESNETATIVTLASRLYYFVGIGFAIGSLPFALYMLLNHRVPTFLGIRFYGGGFIEKVGGFDALMISSWASLLITPVNILVGYWLAQSLRMGAVLGLLLFPISMFFALGYAAPAPIILHPILVIVILLAWGYLT